MNLDLFQAVMIILFPLREMCLGESLRCSFDHWGQRDTCQGMLETRPSFLKATEGRGFSQRYKSGNLGATVTHWWYEGAVWAQKSPRIWSRRTWNMYVLKDDSEPLIPLPWTAHLSNVRNTFSLLLWSQLWFAAKCMLICSYIHNI